jgi:hypothetical protein
LSELAAQPGVLVGELLVAVEGAVSLARSDASVARWAAVRVVSDISTLITPVSLTTAATSICSQRSQGSS